MANTDFMGGLMKVFLLVIVVLLVAAGFDALRVMILSLLSGVVGVMLPQAVMLFVARRQAAEMAFALWAAKFLATIILLVLFAIALKKLDLLSAMFFIGGVAMGILFNVAALVRWTKEGAK